MRARLQSALGHAFRLEGELSGSGMTRVFVGTETALGRRVVLKALVPDATSTEQVARFRREAVLAARLLHPHIVPIFSVGTVARFQYYTMPFIAGESLRVRLDRASAMPVDAAVRLFREIANALAFAHANGVVHRDVKPENIVLEHGTGRALLADFGIAFAPGESDGLTTQAGTTIGTPVYMSPEQVDGLELDGRSDIYSLGLVAWEMLTGERPWAGESTYAVMYRQKNETLPPLSHYDVDVPPAIASAIERCLIKDRDARWRSADELLSAIGDSSDAPNILSHSASVGATGNGAISDLRAGDTADQVETAGDPWAGLNPAMVPTVAMAVARASRARAGQAPAGQARSGRTTSPIRERPHADPDARPALSWMAQDAAGSSWSPSRGLSGREDLRDTGRRRVRWMTAACAAALVTGSIVGAATLRHPGVRWRLTADDSASAIVPGAMSDPRVDTVAASTAADDLAQVQSAGTVTDPGDTSPYAPLVQMAAVAERHVRRETRTSLSHSDSVRGRAATATLALQAYQNAIAPLRASAASPTPSPRSDDAVLRAPQMAAPLAPTASPADNTPEALAPGADVRPPGPPRAAAVRVVPQTQTPIQARPLPQAQPVRVRHP